MSAVVQIGQIAVFLQEPSANTGQLVCGKIHCDMSHAAAFRFSTELTKIRTALSAARAVLTDRASSTAPTSAAEMHLARLLVELEIFS
jgi:hypothetical protein